MIDNTLSNGLCVIQLKYFELVNIISKVIGSVENSSVTIEKKNMENDMKPLTPLRVHDKIAFHSDSEITSTVAVDHALTCVSRKTYGN
mgnify:CR=1 FL=1